VIYPIRKVWIKITQLKRANTLSTRAGTSIRILE